MFRRAAHGSASAARRHGGAARCLRDGPRHICRRAGGRIDVARSARSPLRGHLRRSGRQSRSAPGSRCQAVPAPFTVWQWLTIRAGMPDRHGTRTQDQLVAQSGNWDVLGGVNFRKGCYTGQEIIARTQYLGRHQGAIVRVPRGCGRGARGRASSARASTTSRAVPSSMRPRRLKAAVDLLAVRADRGGGARRASHVDAPDGPLLVPASRSRTPFRPRRAARARGRSAMNARHVPRADRASTRTRRIGVVIAANRDEYHARPAAPAAWWDEGFSPGATSRRAARGSGSIARGRFALLTNVREPSRHDPSAPSRGTLVPRLARRGRSTLGGAAGARRAGAGTTAST